MHDTGGGERDGNIHNERSFLPYTTRYAIKDGWELMYRVQGNVDLAEIGFVS